MSARRGIKRRQGRCLAGSKAETRGPDQPGPGNPCMDDLERDSGRASGEPASLFFRREWAATESRLCDAAIAAINWHS